MTARRNDDEETARAPIAPRPIRSLAKIRPRCHSTLRSLGRRASGSHRVAHAMGTRTDEAGVGRRVIAPSGNVARGLSTRAHGIAALHGTVHTDRRRLRRTSTAVCTSRALASRADSVHHAADHQHERSDERHRCRVGARGRQRARRGRRPASRRLRLAARGRLNLRRGDTSDLDIVRLVVGGVGRIRHLGVGGISDRGRGCRRVGNIDRRRVGNIRIRRIDGSRVLRIGCPLRRLGCLGCLREICRLGDT